MSDVAALYRLQELELEIIERAKRIKAINAELEDDAILQESVAENEAAQAALVAAEARVLDMELEIASTLDKLQTAEQRLYSGEVKNPKELQDMQMEVEALSRRKSVLDDELQKIMSNRDELRGKAEDAEARCKELREQHEQQSKELLTEKETLTEVVNQLLARRKTSVAAIPQQDFKTYNSMRTAKSNRPVAVLKEKACAICGIEQNSIVTTAINRSEGLVHCQSCGRILIRL
jgi:predicted  nucleic acid-binding Zn-ribbon protein